MYTVWQTLQTGITFTIDGARHYNYTDMCNGDFIRQTEGACGTIEALHMNELLKAYTLAFFNKHLKGIDSIILTQPPTDFPEITNFHVK